MCGLCAVFALDHWAELGDGRRDRALRTRMLQGVLRHFGLALYEWAGAVYVVSDHKGRTAVVEDVGTLWRVAESLHGGPLDPLEPALLATLAIGGE